MPPKTAFIERCTEIHQTGWLEMRVALWPDATPDEHRGYMAICLAQPERFLQLMIYDEKRTPIGFIEGSIRSDYVNGTESSPVGFVEGVYVVPALRRQGIARRLFDAIAIGRRRAVAVNWPRMRCSRTSRANARISRWVSRKRTVSSISRNRFEAFLHGGARQLA
jgi:GNAT superfamily N-acetyltransferase